MYRPNLADTEHGPTRQAYSFDWVFCPHINIVGIPSMPSTGYRDSPERESSCLVVAMELHLVSATAMIHVHGSFVERSEKGGVICSV